MQNKPEKKAKRLITIDPEIDKALKQAGVNVSGLINSYLKQYIKRLGK